MLNRYQRQLVELSDQLRKLIEGHSMTRAIDPSQLQGVSERQMNRHSHGLREEVRESDKRRLRTKSGRSRSERRGSLPVIGQLEAYKREVIERKKKLEAEMETHVETKGNQVIFSKKYAGSNLNEYLRQR